MASGQSRVARLVMPVSERDHVQGPATAPATLVEYGDYECPFCGQAHPIVKAVQARLGPRMRYVFRPFPLTEIHPRALVAAEAAEAAGAQGRFWQMHDLLFENQPAFSDPDLVRYGTALGLDVPRFVTEVAERVYEPRIREDFMSGVRSGVNGTPTFFINGIRHDGPWDVATLTNELLAVARVPA
jgi:protein-disulfide isomerase